MTRRSATIARPTTAHGRAATRPAVAGGAPVAATASALAASATCPTCLAAGAACLDALPGAAHPGVLPAQCPTCGVTSIEYGLVIAIDNVLLDMHGLDRLDAAI